MLYYYYFFILFLIFNSFIARVVPNEVPKWFILFSSFYLCTNSVGGRLGYMKGPKSPTEVTHKVTKVTYRKLQSGNSNLSFPDFNLILDHNTNYAYMQGVLMTQVYNLESICVIHHYHQLWYEYIMEIALPSKSLWAVFKLFPIPVFNSYMEKWLKNALKN